MYISPITANYANTNLYRQNKTTSTPNFKGALNDNQMERVLKLLAPKNNEVFEKFSGQKLKDVMDNLMNKYKSLGVSSIGIQIVSNDDLSKLLGKNIGKYNTNGKMGLCVAVGDKYGPIENMNKIYEAKTFLVNEKDLMSLN